MRFLCSHTVLPRIFNINYQCDFSSSNFVYWSPQRICYLPNIWHNMTWFMVFQVVAILFGKNQFLCLYIMWKCRNFRQNGFSDRRNDEWIKSLKITVRKGSTWRFIKLSESRKKLFLKISFLLDIFGLNCLACILKLVLVLLGTYGVFDQTHKINFIFIF